MALMMFLVIILGCEKKELSDWDGEFDISIMSFNIKFDTEEDGYNRWDNRKEACLEMLKDKKPLIFGVQEALHHQVRFLDSNLPDYSYVGVGRDDGHSSGEYSAIYYSNQRFELIKNGNFWLSETPDFPSLGWDANNIRIVSWAHLNDLELKKQIFVFNTHFDHLGKKARRESAKLLVSKVEEIVSGEVPVFLTGDFNALIGNSIMEPIIESYFSARRFAEQTDDNKSYNAWGKWYLNRNIDYIFFRNSKALSFKTIIDGYGVPYLSDHYPIIGHFNIN